MQGEEQKKLDVLSNDVFINALVSSGRTVRSGTFLAVFPDTLNCLLWFPFKVCNVLMSWTLFCRTYSFLKRMKTQLLWKLQREEGRYTQSISELPFMYSGSYCSFHMLTVEEVQFTHKGMSYIDVPLFTFVGIVLFSTHWMGRPTLTVVSPSERYILSPHCCIFSYVFGFLCDAIEQQRLIQFFLWTPYDKVQINQELMEVIVHAKLFWACCTWNAEIFKQFSSRKEQFQNKHLFEQTLWILSTVVSKLLVGR